MRGVKLYEKEILLVRNMGPGDVITFKVKHPWGLVHKIYRTLKLWKAEQYFTIRINEDKTIRVEKEDTKGLFIYDDEFE